MSGLEKSDATRRRDRIKLLLGTMVETKEKVLALITQAKDNDDHLDLGYRSWTEYVSTEYAQILADLNREDRRFAAFALSQTGMSTRTIAPILGVSKSSVDRDIAQVSHDGTPDASEGECPGHQPLAMTDRGRPGTVRMVTGLDGKTYVSATAPATDASRSTSTKRRKKLPDAFHDATHEISRVSSRLETLHRDERFAANVDTLRRHRADLFRAQTILRRLIADLGTDEQGVLL